MPAIDVNDAATELTTPLSENDASDIFLKRFLPADADKQPSDNEDDTPKGEDKDDASQPKDGEDNSADEQLEKSDDDKGDEEPSDEDDKGEKHKDADDDAYVKIKVGDDEHEVAVKDLKRLYGQEAALTKKSMEVAQQRKAADDEMKKSAVASSALLDRAKARFAPYQQIDFMLAAKELPAEQYQALKQEAQAAFEDVQFFEKSLNGLMSQINNQRENTLIETAKKSLEILGGPVEKGGIPGWSDKLYDDIRSFAVSSGVPQEIVNNTVEDWAIRIMHSAMLYERGKSKVITTKVNKTPKKVIKTSITPKSGNTKGDKSESLMRKLRKTGSTDDATELFLSRWESGDQE